MDVALISVLSAFCNKDLGLMDYSFSNFYHLLNQSAILILVS